MMTVGSGKLGCTTPIVGVYDFRSPFRPDACIIGAPAVPLMETCAACDAVAVKHPFAAVRRDAGGEHYAPVCAACHADPAHRTRPIKGHFYPIDPAGAGPLVTSPAIRPPAISQT